MSQDPTQDTTILRQIYDPTNRANPYPYWAQLRQTPVCWQDDGPDEAGAYVASTYREIEALLHHPLVSSDLRNSVQTGGRPRAQTDPYQFISLDPPEHDRLRQLTMRHFGPPERPAFLEQLRPEILRIVTALLDQLQGQRFPAGPPRAAVSGGAKAVYKEESHACPTQRPRPCPDL